VLISLFILRKGLSVKPYIPGTIQLSIALYLRSYNQILSCPSIWWLRHPSIRWSICSLAPQWNGARENSFHQTYNKKMTILGLIKVITINSQHLFLIVLEAGSLRPRHQHRWVLVRALFQVSCIFTWWKESLLALWTLLSWPSWPNYSHCIMTSQSTIDYIYNGSPIWWHGLVVPYCLCLYKCPLWYFHKDKIVQQYISQHTFLQNVSRSKYFLAAKQCMTITSKVPNSTY
jgi:hypothetical protein